jgi:hypothetical protein
MFNQLGAQAPDLVITDNGFQAGETGLQVIQRARNLFGANLPALLISGDTDPGLAGELAAQGVGLRLKPLQWSEMESYLRGVSQRREP